MADPAAGAGAGAALPIEAHGVIGNLSTVALVGIDGTIDHLCWPKLDSPSLFAAILDPERGGAFRLAPEMDDAVTRQIYLPDNNVLSTRWLSPQASVEVLDLMVVSDGRDADPPRLVRRVTASRGAARVRLVCRPRYGYGLRDAAVRPVADGVGFSGAADDPALRLVGTQPITASDGVATAEFTLQPGEAADFILEDDREPGDGNTVPLGEIGRAIDATSAFWRGWTARSDYRGRWRNEMSRAALVLKLLPSREHGSIAAAATFGLPERRGGDLNWDYRASWIRDASFTVYAFIRLGHVDEAIRFMRWVAKRVDEIADRDGIGLRTMYRLDGGSDLAERQLDHLAGYGAQPVRVGNEAAGQMQLDIYGELLDAVYLNAKYGEPPGFDAWRRISYSVDFVCSHWREPDAGIWEVRGEPQHFLHSRLMCWVAVDRALRLATKRSLPAPYQRWSEVRNEIHASIWEEFWSGERGHFVQARGSTDVDGALLLMPLVRFVTGTDPRWLATLDRIGEQLGDDGLVFRTPAGRAGQEGAFAACSFWYVECLARAGRLSEAHAVLERTLSYANHLGLYAEEFDVQARHLGNFPQALTHLALISAAYYLDRALSGARLQP